MRDMTYKVEQWVRKIKSPIIAKINDKELPFNNGNSFADLFTADKPVIINYISVSDGKIVVELIENKIINDTSWSDKENSYF